MYIYGRNFYLVNDRNFIYGHVCIYCNNKLNKNAFITSIFVDKQESNSKLDSLKLLNLAESEALKFNNKNVLLEVHFENKNAIGFYLRNNYCLLSFVNDKYLMGKALSL